MAKENARNRRERGQALVLFVLALGVIMGFTAMTVDVGLFFQERRSLQNAADAAALAGIQELPGSPSAAIAASQEWAAKNGYTSENGATVTVNTPYEGDPNAVEVVIEEEMPFVFASVLGLDSADVAARAVAASSGQGGPADFAIVVLSEYDCKALDKSGSNNLQINGPGGIMVNSDCSGPNAALNKTGGGDMGAEGGIYYYEQGGWSQSGSGLLDPEPAPLSSRVADPLAGLTPPSLYGDPDPTSPDSGGTAAQPDTLTMQSGDYTLHPGVYWGGISVTSQANVTMLPGTYIMAGGGFSLTGGGSITGVEIFIYNTFDPENLDNKYDGNCGVVNLRGNADWILTGPSGGAFEDTIIWQDAACTNPVKFEGSGAGVAGVFYTPSARFDLSGSGNMGSIQIVTDTIDITGSGDMTVDFVAYIDIPIPDRSLKLVE